MDDQALLKAGMIKASILGLLLLGGVVLAGCNNGQARHQQPLTIFAAASLREAMESFQAVFLARHPEARLDLQLRGSQQLATQIKHGAAADLFFSANQHQVQRLETAGAVVPNSGQVIAYNRLTVLTRPGLELDDLNALADSRWLFVMAGPEVPIGRYARRMLELASHAGLGENFRSRVEANSNSLESNVRAAASKVLLGEADLTIAYETDALALADQGINRIAIPESIQVPVEIMAVRLSARDHPLAEVFLKFCESPEGRRIWERYGFTLPPAGVDLEK